MNIDTALEKIYSLKQFHVKLGLDNIKGLLNHIGNPQKKLKTLHIAGSNGKGSTCSFLASILQEYGYKVGLYTSPHFVRFNERIRINGVEISNEQIIDFLERHKEYIDKNSPTFFEITTALAFNYFNFSDVHYAIIETGLGGRLDATNTITPLASIITSISLEHSHILGDTLEKIASEKAGIIKEKVPVFIGQLPSEAVNKISEIAADRNSKLVNLNEEIDDLGKSIKMRIGESEFHLSYTGLKGKHQLKNAALAIKTLEIVLDLKNTNKIQKGLDNIVSNTGIQGRYERGGYNQNIIYDAAHNLEGIEIFLSEFSLEYKNYNDCTLIFGAMKDKQIDKMLKLLYPYFNNIYVTSTNYERAATAEEIKTIAENKLCDVSITNNPAEIIKSFENQNADKCLVILGSIYLIGDIKKKLQK